MPNKQGTYYLGRVIFIGQIDKPKFIKALKFPTSIEIGEHHWTITDFKRFNGSNKKLLFIFGKLSKYKPKGEVDVIDTKSHSEKIKEIDNTKVASSSFVYLPEYSGIAYLHVWNHVQQDIFIRRLKDLVESKYGKFFVECDIEAISDLVAFSKRISELSSVELIRAKVHPPNPLFGPLWAPLKEYLKKRNVDEFTIEEKTKGEQILTDLIRLLKKVERNPSGPIPDITDAAVLMATDGYGQGKIHGIEGDKKVVISTSDSIKNFKHDSEPDPLQLYEAARKMFQEISEKRHMEHEKKNT